MTVSLCVAGLGTRKEEFTGHTCTGLGAGKQCTVWVTLGSHVFPLYS